MMIVVRGALGGERPDMQVLKLTPPIEVDQADVYGVQLHSMPSGQIHGRFRLDTEVKFDWTQLSVNLLPIAEKQSDPETAITYGAAFTQAKTNSTAGADGTFEMKNVPAGSYQLVVGTGFNALRDYYTKSVILGGQDVADSGFAVSGEMYLDVVVSAKGATIEGNVVDNAGKPVAYGTVAVIPNSEQRARPDSYQREATDERGHFSARGLNRGSYVVLAFEELQENMRRPDFFRTYGKKGEKVELEEGTRKSVTAKIIPAETAP